MFSHLFSNKPQNLFLIDYLLQFLFEQDYGSIFSTNAAVSISCNMPYYFYFFITVGSFPGISNRLKTYTRNWTYSRITSIKTEN